MQIRITKNFAFAHRGVDVRNYAAGDVVDADDPQLLEVALAEGWAQAMDAAPAESMRAPEDKDAARLRRTRKA